MVGDVSWTLTHLKYCCNIPKLDRKTDVWLSGPGLLIPLLSGLKKPIALNYGMNVVAKDKRCAP